MVVSKSNDILKLNSIRQRHVKYVRYPTETLFKAIPPKNNYLRDARALILASVATQEHRNIWGTYKNVTFYSSHIIDVGIRQNVSQICCVEKNMDGLM